MTEERKYWEPDVETMPLNKLRELQEERLREIVTWAYEKTKLYRRKFDQAGVKPNDIKTLGDIEKLPLTEELEQRHAPMEEKLAVPFGEIKNVCSTSGTTGLAEVVPFTQEDFRVGCINALCRCKWAAGLRPSDMVQNLSGFTCQSRIDEALGAAVIREHVGRGNLDQQIILAHQMNVTVLMHLPSLVLQYFDRAAELGIDIKKSKLRLVIGAGEPWAESYRKKIEAEYGVIFRNIYGVAQAGELAGECEHDDGMHYNADLYFLEIIDPETKEVLELGEEGELVVTSFFRKAVPRIRYRTGDITKIMPYKPCPCGRTSPKISAVKGKLASLINVGEKRFFPIDVEEVIGSIPELGREYQIILDKPKEQERLKVNVEYKPEVKELAAVRSRVENQIGQSLGVESEVGLVPLGSIGRALFKAQRVVAKY